MKHLILKNRKLIQIDIFSEREQQGAAMRGNKAGERDPGNLANIVIIQAIRRKR